ncbi:MAG: hypothetical protein KBA53_01675 [Thermoclostridium sp.]|nr:hypothetical protein [Thermoclostridium sp.]
MKVHLLYENEEKRPKPAANEKEILQDLNLEVLLAKMSQNNSFLYDTVKSVILSGVGDIGTIVYRQEILKDFIKNPAAIREIYEIAASAVNDAIRYREYTQPNYARVVPVSVRVFKSVGLLELLVQRAEKLKNLVLPLEKSFQSTGLVSFCGRIQKTFPDSFFPRVQKNIADLNYLGEGGRLVLGVKPGKGLKGSDYVLRDMSRTDQLKTRKPAKGTQWNEIELSNYSLAAAAREIEDAGLIKILRLVNHYTSTLLRFFETLQFETGFYDGCVHLYQTLVEMGVPFSFPHPVTLGEKQLCFQGLYDLSLALNERKTPVQNDLNATAKKLIVITGANQGGKSTWLRSIGQAQLMMQCGMFVAAESFQSGLCDRLFTHFTREEDIRMNSGKLDEELVRMERTTKDITPSSLLLMNESFASTTEREGSKIARDITTALTEAGMRILFVTHLYDFARAAYDEQWESTLFLRAGRNSDASRSFLIQEGEPLSTSYGEDLFNSMIAG